MIRQRHHRRTLPGRSSAALVARLEATNKRLRATIRRLRYYVQGQRDSARPDGGPHMDGSTAYRDAIVHDRETKKLMKKLFR